MVAGPSKVLTRKTVVDETRIRKITIVCKAIVAIDASQPNAYSMRQPMPTRLYREYEFHADLQRLNPRQKKCGSVENMVLSYFKRQRPSFKIETFHTTGSQKKIDCLNADGFCGHCKRVFEARSCFYRYCRCRETRPALLKKSFNVDQMR